MSKSEQYNIRVQATPRFSVRADVARNLGIWSGDDVHLTVTHNGKLRLSGRHTLRSGLEVFGATISANVEPGELIHVVARRVR
jgi:hypothetical protein